MSVGHYPIHLLEDQGYELDLTWLEDDNEDGTDGDPIDVDGALAEWEIWRGDTLLLSRSSADAEITVTTLTARFQSGLTSDDVNELEFGTARSLQHRFYVTLAGEDRRRLLEGPVTRG